MSASATIGGGNEATIPPQPVDGTGTFNLVATIAVAHAKLATLTGIVGDGAALTGLKVSVAANVDGTHVDRVSNAGFNTSTELVPFSGRSDDASPPNVYQTPAGDWFQIVLNLSGAAEVKVWAASSGSGTTLALEAMA